MGCVNSWVSVEMFCAYLNQMNKKIDLQAEPNQVNNMFGELLEHIVELGYQADADEIIAAYKANPNSPEAAQFKKDWELATNALEGSRISAQKAMIASDKPTRFDRLPDIDSAVVIAIDNYITSAAAVQPNSIPIRPSSGTQIDEEADDQESAKGPGASQEDIPLVSKEAPMLSVNSVRDANTRGIVTVIQEMMGESRIGLFGDFMSYMHAKISEGWIDQQVIGGEVRGMVSAEHSARAIKAGFNNTLVEYYKNRSNGEIGVYSNSVSQGKYLFFNADNKPSGLNLVSEHEGYKIFKHDTVKQGDLLDNGKYEPVFFVVADEGGDIDSVVDSMTKLAKKITAVPYPSEPTDTEEDYLGTGFTSVPDTLKGVYFASMIAGNYEEFMKNFYPPVMEGYKSKFRTGFVNDDTSIVAADQDSARIFMHKRTTPRLRVVLDSVGRFAGVKADEKSPYLRNIDFELVADVIATKGFRRNVEGFGEDVLEYIKSNPKTTEAQILASIYYRFFAPTDYEVQIDKDPITGETAISKTFRSYKGLVDNNSTNKVTRDEYNEWVANGSKKEQAPHINSNSALDNALSGIITSLSSAVQHESAISNNGSVRFTNTRSYDIIPRYKAAIETYSTFENAEGMSITRPDVLKGLTVRSLGKNKIRVSISDPRAKVTGNYKQKTLDYDVKINTGNTEGGLLFTVEKFPTAEQLSYSELKTIFRQFSFSPVTLSSRFMAEFTSAASRLENEANKERPAEQFLLSSLLLLEMNQEQEKSEVVKNIEGLDTVYSSSTMRYDPVEMLYQYKPVLEDSLRGIFGVDNRQYAIDHNGNKMAIVTLKNKIADSVSLARRMGELPSSIHRNGMLTGRDPKVKIDGYFTKTGIKVGDTVKSNQEMTIHEQASYQIEQLFLQTASESNFRSSALQFGVISDKTNIPAVKLSAAKQEDYFLPTKNGGTELDKETLHDEFVNSQKNYWANVGEGILTAWNDVLASAGAGPLSTDIFVAAEQVRAMNLPYRAISSGTSLTKNAMLAEGNSADENVQHSIAVIPTHVLNNIAIFNNPELSRDFVNNNLELFKRALKKEGYTKVSQQAFAILKKRFPGAGFTKLSNDQARELAADTLFTAFFYHSNTLGQEILRMHTGGFIQFKMPKGEPIFKIGPKGINTKQVLAKAKSLQKTNILFNSILANKNLTPENQAKALVFDEVAGVHSTQFIDQVKRNAGMSSTGQYMRLNSPNNKGFYLGQSSKNVVIDDPNIKLQILGKSGVSGQDAYDAVQIGHPLYFMRLGNSLGNNESNFSPKGAPVKDITNAMDEQGYYRFQKKATFDMFSFETLRKGTKALYNMLVKTNTAIRFPDTSVLVTEIDPHTNKLKRGDFKTALNEEMWVRNGHALGLVYDSEEDAVVDVQSLLKGINESTNEAQRQAAIADLQRKLNPADPKLFTDKIERNFDNLQQLWEYFGSTENEESWNHVADVIGNYAGVHPGADLTLATATYPLRDAYIEKVGFKSQEKTGSKQVLPAEAVTDDSIVFGSDTFTGWSEVDNTYHTVILQADHNPDTSHNGSSLSTDEEEIENHIPMITQILSAIVGEGMSIKDVIAVYNSLGITSQLYNDQVEADINELKDNIKLQSKPPLSEGELQKRAVAEYFIKQLRQTVSTMATPGVIGDLVGNTYKDRMSFDTKQVLPLLVSTSNAVFNRNTVRMTFAGGQYIVSPSHDFIKTYKVMGVDGYTRDDLNKILYDESHPLHATASQDQQFALVPATVQELLPNDKVVLDIVNETVYGNLVSMMGLQPGAVLSFAKLKRLIKEHYAMVPEIAEMPFESVVANFIADSAKFRLGGLHETANTLSWTKYHKYENGVKIEIKDTPEYKAFQSNTDPTLTKELEKPLYDLLQQDGWVTEAAEFYMPSMHKSVFMLEDSDSLFDVIGAEDPDYTKVVSMGIIQPGTYSEVVGKDTMTVTISDNEDLYRQLNTNFRAINKVFGPGTKAFAAMSDEQQTVYSEFARARIEQFNHSYTFFRGRLTGKYGTIINEVRNSSSIDQAIQKVKRSLKKVSETSEEGKMWSLILTHLNASKEKTNIDEGKGAVDERTMIRAAFNQKRGNTKRNIVDEFYHSKSKKMASGFTTSLEFITARIPAQGKQSGTVGRIKNFVFSSRNSCYGPLEMLTMTGADYDIDKQNMMTWQFDDDGALIDWKPFLGPNGEISKQKFNEWATANEMSTKEASEYFKLAVQNFIVHKIISVFKSPKNAIESNTPVSMDKVKGAKVKPDLTKAKNATTVADILELREHASPYNPADIFKYEKLNMDGKSGIGIFASDLKGYFATYYATVTSTKNEGQFIAFKSNSGLDILTMNKMGIDPAAVQYFDLKSGELLTQSSSIANTGRFVGEGLKTSNRAKEGIAKLQALDVQGILESYTNGTLNPDDHMNITTRMNEDQVSGALEGEDATANLIYAIQGLVADKERVILQEYLDDINKAKDANVEEQAWEDLSELLSAATDNAKELILGQINATSSTSSIISTMVRMGIDLKYALQLVGHSDTSAPAQKVQIGTETYDIRNIRELIRKLDDIGDTQKEGAGFARLTPVLEKMQPTISSSATPDQVKAYLANPFRQLYTFAKITEEFGLISSLLSINQGLKTTAYDAWRFKNSIESRINDILGDDSFKLDKFIASELGDKRYSGTIIAAFDKKRTGVNVPFILSKNAHYFGYYNAMFTSKSLIGAVSSVDKATEDIINQFADKQTKRRITDQDFKNIQNFIYGVSVEGYLKDKVVTINGKIFDLSVASKPLTTDSDIGGRFEFIQYLPEAVYEASNFGVENHFLNSIPVQDSVVDYVTQTKLPVLKGPNLLNISPERYAELKIGLNTLKRTHKELYDALFLYSLITTKGAFAGGSFMALYNTDKYIGFSEYVKDNSKYITAVAGAKANTDIITFNNPVFIEMLSTDTDKSKAYLKRKKGRLGPDGEEVEESWTSEDTQVGDMMDHMEHDGHDGMIDGIEEESFRRKRTFVDMSKKLFDMTNVTTGKLRGNIKANLIRSKETGIIYKWDADIEIWIPIVQRIPNTVIPYSAVNAAGVISDTGFSEGWDVNLSTSGTNGPQKTVRVISFMDSELLKRLRDVREGESNSELGRILGVDHNIPLDKKTDYYLVKDAGGKYSIESKDILMTNSKNNLILDGPKIARKFTSGREDMELEKRHYFFKKDGVLYDREIPGSVKTSSVVISPARVASAESMTGKFFPFDLMLMKEISEGFDNTVPMSSTDLDRQYDAVMKAYLDNLLLAHNEDRGAAMEELDSTFSIYAPQLTKLNTLFNADEMFKERFADVERADTDAPVDDYIINKKAVPSIVRRLLTDRAMLESTSWAQIQELFSNLKIPGERFRALVKTSVMGKGSKLDVFKGMTQKTTIEGVVTPFKKLIVSDKIIDTTKYSKDHTVPEDMKGEFNRQASPEVLAKLLGVLQEKFPDSSFTMMGTAQIEMEFGKEYSKPGVKAFVSNGKVIFNQERMTLDTPVHEYSHIYMQYLKVDNKELYHKLVSEALNHPLAKHMAKSYPNISKFELGEEVVVSLIAAHVNGLTSENENLDNIVENTSRGKQLFDKVLQFFKDVFGKAFNISPSKLKFKLTDSVGDIIAQIGNQVAYGKGSMLEDFSPQLREVIRKARNGETIDYQEILTLLKKRGFVERVCV